MTASGANRPAGRVAAAGVLVVSLLAIGVYGRKLDAVYPIHDWLFWTLAQLWFWVALFNAACFSFGCWLSRRVLRLTELPLLEAAVVSMAFGIVSFVMGMYLGGALGWYTPVFAVALPLAMIARGAGEGFALLRALRDESRARPRGSLLDFAITAGGVVCVTLIYLGCMTPDALNYDSAWYHMVEAQEYARAGRMVPFLADYCKNMPQLASLIYTWGFVVPGLDQPALHWMLALHNEFGVFVWTLVAVSAGVRALAGDNSIRGAWVAFFLFPIIFVYDHNLGGAADHVCAFFSIPIMLMALRLCAGFSRRYAAALAIVCAGAILTKYQASYMAASAAVLIAVCWLRFIAEHRRGRVRSPRVPLRTLLAAPAIVAGLGLALISPHFIRQTVFHHNPIYPFLQNVFRSSTPTSPDAQFLLSWIATDANWIPPGNVFQRFWHACQLFFSFSFEPHYSFTGNVPVFGSLFTLLLPTLVFVRERVRVAQALVIGGGSLLIWGMVYNVDRNLQIFMPIFVCITGALLTKAWRMGALARLGCVPLVALQIVWGGDVMLFSSYTRVQSSFELIRSGLDHRAQQRLLGYRSSFLAIGNAVPKNAKLLLHTAHVSLGIEREVLFDWSGFQFLISYAKIHTPRELFDYYRSLGITHLLYEPSARSASTKQEEVLWAAFVTRYAEPAGDYGGYRLLRMPRIAPPPEPAYHVATVGLSGYEDGIYPIERMNRYEYIPVEMRKISRPELRLPEEHKARTDALSNADAIVVGPGALDSGTQRLVHHRFTHAAQIAGQFTVYLRMPDSG